MPVLVSNTNRTSRATTARLQADAQLTRSEAKHPHRFPVLPRHLPVRRCTINPRRPERCRARTGRGAIGSARERRLLCFDGKLSPPLHPRPLGSQESFAHSERLSRTVRAPPQAARATVTAFRPSLGRLCLNPPPNQTHPPPPGRRGRQRAAAGRRGERDPEGPTPDPAAARGGAARVAAAWMDDGAEFLAGRTPLSHRNSGGFGGLQVTGCLAAKCPQSCESQSGGSSRHHGVITIIMMIRVRVIE